MFIDTHCHINLIAKKTFNIPLSNEDVQHAQTVIDAAQRNGVVAIVNVGTNYIESKNCVTLAQTYPSCFAAVGIHPDDATENWRTELAEIEHDFLHNKQECKIVAIGEIGIDLYRRTDTEQRQIDVFKAHIELALKYNLPIIIHSRNAADQTLRIIESYRHEIKHCVFHCFGYGQDYANTIISWGYLLGISATITYPKNTQLQEIVTQNPLSNFVLETDAPFLPPQPLRGKQNSPAYLIATAQKIATLKETSLDRIGQHTTQNAKKLFNI